MKITKENLDNYEVALTIELEADKLAEAKKTACKNIANRYSFPGFRKGKAPAQIVEQQLGKEYIMEEAADILINKASIDALEEQDLHSVTEIKPEVITNEDGKDFVFKITFTPYPKVELGEYKGLDIKSEIDEITDEDVENQVKAMQEHHATMIDAPADAKVKDGDFTTLDFQGFMDGKPFENGEGKSYPLKIGSKTFIPGFEEGLIGSKIGEEREIEVTFPEDYQAQELAGKPATFKCKVLSIKNQQLPEVNDEFVQKISKFKTVDEFKADIRKNLEISAKRKALEQRGRKAIEQVTDEMKVDVPPVMVENRITQLINEFTLQLQATGMTLEHYMQYSGNDMEKIRESYKESAQKDVLTDLALEEIARREKITVDSKELGYEVAVLAAQYGSTPKQVAKILRENRQINTVAANVRRRKAARCIIEAMVKDEALADVYNELNISTSADKSNKKATEDKKSDTKADETDKVDKSGKSSKTDKATENKKSDVKKDSKK